MKDPRLPEFDYADPGAHTNSIVALLAIDVLRRDHGWNFFGKVGGAKSDIGRWF